MESEVAQPAAEVPPTAAGEAEGDGKVEGDAQVEGEGAGADAGEGEGEGEGKSETEAAVARKFEFNFDDEPKKKKKSKKSKKDKKFKSYNREHYETIILSLNSQLAALRKSFVRKDEVNLKVASELATIEADRIDVCEHLDRTLGKRQTQIVELEETFEKLQEEYASYKEVTSQRIDELQKLYASVEKQLKSEIELQERALSSLDEFRVRREAVLDRYRTTHDHVEDMERQCKEDLFNLEQKNSVQKNVLKKEVKMRLQQMAEDFLHSSEIRNAGYTRNLIRENITLHKTVDRRVKQNISIMEEREKQFLKTKEIMESYSSLEQFNEHLEHTIANKDAIIKRLTGRIDRMKTKFIDARRYRNLCDKAMQKGLFKPKGPQNLSDMTAHLEQLKTEKFALHWLTYYQEPEIERLTQMLDKLMTAVMMATDAFHSTEHEATATAAASECDVKETQRALRQNMVAELIPIVSGITPGFENTTEDLQQPHHSAVYRPGFCGLIPRQSLGSVTAMDLLYDHAKDEISGPASAGREEASVSGMEFGSYCYYSHTPSVQSSPMLSRIEECSVELKDLDSLLSSGVGSKYKQKRCSCPKPKYVEMDDDMYRNICRDAHELWKVEKSNYQCFPKPQSTNCFSFVNNPYCSESSSIYEERAPRSNKVSVMTANTFVSFFSAIQTIGDKKNLTRKESCECD